MRVFFLLLILFVFYASSQSNSSDTSSSSSDVSSNSTVSSNSSDVSSSSSDASSNSSSSDSSSSSSNSSSSNSTSSSSDLSSSSSDSNSTTNVTKPYVDPPTQSLCNLADAGKVGIYGGGPQLCIVIIGNTDNDTYTTQNRTVFRPKVDDFALLQVARSHSTNMTSSAWIASSDVHIRLEIGGADPSEWRLRALATNVVPFWTAIINVDQGRVTGISWDDGCFACDDNACINKTCGVPLGSCYEETASGIANGQSTNCDLKIYIGWKGTDKNGNMLTSYSRRLSAFRQYSLSKVYNSAKANTNLPSIPDPRKLCSDNVPQCK